MRLRPFPADIMHKRQTLLPPSHSHSQDKRRKMAGPGAKKDSPRQSDLYLTLILDGLNVQFTDQDQRFRFKEAYEKFKLYVSSVIFFIAVLGFMVHYR